MEKQAMPPIEPLAGYMFDSQELAMKRAEQSKKANSEYVVEVLAKEIKRIRAFMKCNKDLIVKPICEMKIAVLEKAISKLESGIWMFADGEQ